MLRSFVCAAALLAMTAPAPAVELDQFLPKETDLVISLNVRQVLDSPLVKKYADDLVKTILTSSKDARETIKAMGLDPLTDFNRISLGMGLEDFSNPKAVIVVEGKFDVRKIADLMEALAKKEPKQFGVVQVSGKTVYTIATRDQPAPMYAAPIDANVVVFATAKETVAAAFDAVNGTRTATIKKELADLLAKANRQSSVYAVACTKDRLDAIPLPDASMKKVVAQIQSITYDLKVEQDVALELTFASSNAADAKKLQDLLAGLLALAKTQVKIAVGRQPEMQPLVDLVSSLKVAQKEKTVVINGKLSGEALERALKK